VRGEFQQRVQEFRLTSLLQSPLQRLQFLDRLARAVHHAEGLEAAMEISSVSDVGTTELEQLVREARPDARIRGAWSSDNYMIKFQLTSA
jgi:hypothetical protein